MAKSHDSGGTSEINQKYITFSLGDEEYGIPVLQVLEIVRMDNLISIPHSRDYFMGLMDIRGQVLPIIDLKKKLNIHMENVDHALDRAIVIQAGGRKIGLAVDKVAHVLHFSPDSIDAGPSTVKSASSRFITGVGKHQDHFIILMNLENLFSAEEIAGLVSG